jgi:hypothetical protein
MDNENDYPKIGKDINSWKELDSYLPILDLDIELFRRRNVGIASLVILSALIRSNKYQRDRLLEFLTTQYFDPKSLPQYLFEKIVMHLQKSDFLSEDELEKWIPDYSVEVWGISSPKGRSLFADHFTLRQILNFEPNEEQVKRAIELRKMVIDRKK